MFPAVAACGSRIMARSLPLEWCSHLAKVCHEFDDTKPRISPSTMVFGSCTQTLLNSVDVPLMYLMPPVIIWSLLEQFPMLKSKIFCPKCTSSGLRGTALHASGWRDEGRRSEPRRIYGDDCVTLLVGRVYTCTKGHKIVGYHPDIIRSIPACFLPFSLWHKTGFTKHLTQLITSLITSGTSIYGIADILFQKQAIWYCDQKKKFLELCGGESRRFPSLEEWQKCFTSSLPSQHAATGCFLQDFWTKEARYTKCMEETSIDGWLSCDHTFASAGKP